MHALVAVGLLCSLGLGCRDGRAESGKSKRPAEMARTAKKAEKRRGFDRAAFDRMVAGIEREREKLGARYRRARTERARAAIRRQARRFVLDAIERKVFGPWMGTPWGMGRNSTSLVPHQKGMVVGCSYFVTSVLINAGLRLSNRYQYARAPALHIQRSLAPARSQLHRYFSIPVQALERKVRALGEGLYLIGLHNHIGFVLVRGRQVRFIHSSVLSGKVVDEPFGSAEAIALSRRAGYFVTPLFADHRLIDHWLRGKVVPFRALGF